jgi:hypothetical protein
MSRRGVSGRSFIDRRDSVSFRVLIRSMNIHGWLVWAKSGGYLFI